MAYTITDTDRDVLLFVEAMGSITLNQCRNIFYNKQNRGYEIARRRLSKLVANDRLKVARDIHSNQNVYYMTKKLSYHNLLSLDYYSELVRIGAKIHYFKREQKWDITNTVSDAFCVYSVKDDKGKEHYKFDVIEVVRTTALDKKKYVKLYESNEPQILCNVVFEQATKNQINIFPRLIVIDDIVHHNPIEVHEKIKVIQLDFSMQGISKLLI